MIRRSLKLATALLLLASGPAFAGTDREGEVRAVSLVPAAGRAELVIHVAGAGEVTDQTLRDPNRIVLDVAGTHLAAGVERLVYDGIPRAGVRNVRIRQFAPGVVRIVLDMDQIVPYRIERTPDAIRVSFGIASVFADAERFIDLAASLRDQTRLAVGEVTFDIDSCRIIRDGS